MGKYDFLKNIPDADKRYHMLEGYIYPDTYEFYIGENASSVVRRFLDNFESKWTADYAKQAKELDMTVDEIVTLASIIQAEGAFENDAATIAGIIYNRLFYRHNFKFGMII